ncbi:MAG: protein TolQ [Deltaproteobacteria bacterium]|nr:protein TolQ [Deltaproteobacteria bacterium]
MPISDHSEIIQLVLHAGPMVRFVLFLLLLFSVACWAIIFNKFRLINKARKQSAVFLDLFWNRRSLSEAYAASKKLTYCPLSRVFRVAYAELRKVKTRQTPPPEKPASQSEDLAAIANIKRALRRAVNVERTGLNKAVPFLATTGNTAPFVGLFGTVWGIMNAFRGIGLKGSASLAVVAPGISEALVATAAGLAAAIPAVVAYNYFSSKIDELESEMHNFSADFLNLVERELIIRKGNDIHGDGQRQ